MQKKVGVGSSRFAGVFYASFLALYMGLMRLTVAPYLRRFQPTLLIGWNRLLAGRLHDPVVGRDLLIGAVTDVWCGL